jgi:protein-disulfide isomerase
MRNDLKGRIFLAIFLILASVDFGRSQDVDMDIRKEIQELRQGQEAILKDLNEIKAILKSKILAQSGPPNVRGLEIDIGHNPVLGSRSAQLILLEMSDYECQFCGQYARETFPAILKLYIETGKLAYTIIDMPLPNHKMAPKAAEAAHCANEQGKYLEMHDQLMQKQDSLNDLAGKAGLLNLDVPRFEECLKTNKYADTVTGNTSLGLKLGISGVPGFILAFRDSENPSKFKGISASLGLRPFESFQAEIDQALENIRK